MLGIAPSELDVIAICCEFTEYDNFQDFQDVYQMGSIKTLEDLEEHTQVIPIYNGDKLTEGFIIQDF